MCWFELWIKMLEKNRSWPSVLFTPELYVYYCSSITPVKICRPLSYSQNGCLSTENRWSFNWHFISRLSEFSMKNIAELSKILVEIFLSCEQQLTQSLWIAYIGFSFSQIKIPKQTIDGPSEKPAASKEKYQKRFSWSTNSQTEVFTRVKYGENMRVYIQKKNVARQIMAHGAQYRHIPVNMRNDCLQSHQ